MQCKDCRTETRTRRYYCRECPGSVQLCPTCYDRALRVGPGHHRPINLAFTVAQFCESALVRPRHGGVDVGYDEAGSLHVTLSVPVTDPAGEEALEALARTLRATAPGMRARADGTSLWVYVPQHLVPSFWGGPQATTKEEVIVTRIEHPMDTGPDYRDDDGYPARLIRCPDCGQMEWWTEAECQDHGRCRTGQHECACDAEPVARS